MPHKIPTLGAVAEAQAEEKQKAKAKGLIASLASLLGLTADKPAAKMTKKTLTTKRVEMEESDTDAGEDAEEVEEDSEVEESTDAGEDAEEGDEEESAEAEGERGESDAITRATAKAYRAAETAYQEAIKSDPLAQALALRSPARLRREAKRATGSSTTGDAMTALSRLRAKTATDEAAAIQKTAKLEARVAAVETESRKTRVDAIVSDAKAAGKAPRRALRAELREYGMKHGTKALSKLVASLSVVVEPSEKLPKNDEHGNPVGAPGNDEQARMMEQAMSGLSEKEREAFRGMASEKIAKLNGAAKVEA